MDHTFDRSVFILCRNKNGRGWLAPGGVRVEGGSVGFQIGGSESDVVMLPMNQGAIDKLLSSKFTIGVMLRWRLIQWPHLFG